MCPQLDIGNFSKLARHEDIRHTVAFRPSKLLIKPKGLLSQLGNRVIGYVTEGKGGWQARAARSVYQAVREAGVLYGVEPEDYFVRSNLPRARDLDIELFSGDFQQGKITRVAHLRAMVDFINQHGVNKTLAGKQSRVSDQELDELVRKVRIKKAREDQDPKLRGKLPVKQSSPAPDKAEEGAWDDFGLETKGSPEVVTPNWLTDAATNTSPLLAEHLGPVAADEPQYRDAYTNTDEDFITDRPLFEEEDSPLAPLPESDVAEEAYSPIGDGLLKKNTAPMHLAFADPINESFADDIEERMGAAYSLLSKPEEFLSSRSEAVTDEIHVRNIEFQYVAAEEVEDIPGGSDVQLPVWSRSEVALIPNIVPEDLAASADVVTVDIHESEAATGGMAGMKASESLNEISEIAYEGGEEIDLRWIDSLSLEPEWISDFAYESSGPVEAGARSTVSEDQIEVARAWYMAASGATGGERARLASVDGVIWSELITQFSELVRRSPDAVFVPGEPLARQYEERLRALRNEVAGEGGNDLTGGVAALIGRVNEELDSEAAERSRILREEAGSRTRGSYVLRTGSPRPR